MPRLILRLVVGMLMLAVLWPCMTGDGPLVAQQEENRAGVDFYTTYEFTINANTVVADEPLVGRRNTSSHLCNWRDDSHRNVSNVRVEFDAMMSDVLSVEPQPGSSLNDTYIWETDFVRENECFGAAVSFGPDSPVSGTPGFSLERSVSPAELTPEVKERTLTLTFTPEEDFEWVDIWVDASHAGRVDGRFVDPQRPDVWVSEDGDSLRWRMKHPRGIQRLTVNIEITLSAGVKFTRNVPRVNVYAYSVVDEGNSRRVPSRSLEFGTWTWTVPGSTRYKWYWKEFHGVEITMSSGPFETSPMTDNVRSAITKGLNWLRSQQNDDGSWDYNREAGWTQNVAMTAHAVLAFLKAGYSVESETVRKGVDFILSRQQRDGSFISARNGRETYETSLAMQVLAAISSQSYANQIDKAKRWLISAQNNERQIYTRHSTQLRCLDEETCWAYGGWGYGKNSLHMENSDPSTLTVWSDLSNTQFALMGLKAAGLASDDPVWQRAINFVSRCQNSDGGFEYHPEGGPNHSGHSYGSMTAAGVLGLRLAGVPVEDERVQKGLRWLRAYFAPDTRPPWNNAHWHYYYLWTASEAFLEAGFPARFEDLEPLEGWYHDFAGYLLTAQAPDGSWSEGIVNWEGGEGETEVWTTILAILVLEAGLGG